jgi:hypothetical protein
VSLPGRDPAEIEALASDRYVDALLAGRDSLDDHDGGGNVATHMGRPDARLTVNEAVRAVSKRLVADLPRFHPSFRFEEQLALRLAEAAAAMRLAPAASSNEPLRMGQPRAIEESRPTPRADLPFAIEVTPPARVTADGVAKSSLEPERHATFDPTDSLDAADARAFLLGGAVAASALSLAGAAWIAWRRRGSASLMTRAVRAAHRGRLPDSVRNVTGLHG